MLSLYEMTSSLFILFMHFTVQMLAKQLLLWNASIYRCYITYFEFTCFGIFDCISHRSFLSFILQANTSSPKSYFLLDSTASSFGFCTPIIDKNQVLTLNGKETWASYSLTKISNYSALTLSLFGVTYMYKEKLFSLQFSYNAK